MFRLKLIIGSLLFFLTAALSFAAGAPAGDLLAQGRVDDAVASLQSRIAANPNEADSYNLLCRAYQTVSNWDAAIASCQKAVALNPQSSEYHLWLGRVYGGKAEHASFFSAASLAKKVRDEFETAVRLDPNNKEARADLADFYVEAPGMVGGGKDKAEKQAIEMGALDPSQASLIRAHLAEKNNDFAGAEAQYRDAIRISDGRPGPWMSLAQFYRRRNQFNEMQAAIQHAVSAPDSQHVLVPAAETLVRAKTNLPLAATLLNRYLASDMVEDAPAFQAHYLLGTVLEQQGDKAGAAKQYRSALALASNFALAQNALRKLGPHFQTVSY
jgi:cytochrome c-type biogenesis protein CcmH/NrfG